MLEQRVTGNNWWEKNMERQIGSVLFMVLNSKLKICSSFSRYPCLRKINLMVLCLAGKGGGQVSPQITETVGEIMRI